MTSSFEYLKKNKAMTRESYPFTGSSFSMCQYDAKDGVTNVSGYKEIEANNPDAHIEALQDGPVAIAIQAST